MTVSVTPALTTALSLPYAVAVCRVSTILYIQGFFTPFMQNKRVWLFSQSKQSVSAVLH